MKTPFCISIVGAILLAGCGQDSSKPAQTTNSTSSSDNPLNAPADYLGALAKARQLAVKTVDTASLNKAIQLFQADHDRYPTNLNELVKEKYIGQIPATPVGTKLDYDPKTGLVKVVKQ